MKARLTFILCLSFPISCTTTEEEVYQELEAESVTKLQEGAEDGCFDVNEEGLVVKRPYGKIRDTGDEKAAPRYCTVDNGVQETVCIHPETKLPYSVYATSVEFDKRPWDCVLPEGATGPKWVLSGVPSTDLQYECTVDDNRYYEIYLGEDVHNIARLVTLNQNTEEKVILEYEEPRQGEHAFREQFKDKDGNMQERVYRMKEGDEPMLIIEAPGADTERISCRKSG